MWSTKPHAICIPLPAQGHINPMLKLAKLLHFKGFYITFVHTEFNYQRLLKSRGPHNSLKGLDDFQFETISDGLPPTNPRGILELEDLCVSMPKESLVSFRDLIMKLSASPNSPPITCIVSDGVMSFTLEVAQEFGIPETIFFTPSACGMLGYLHFEELIERGLFPLKDESCLSNGFLETPIDWIPGMKGVRLKDLPTFIRTTDRNAIMFNYNLESVNNSFKAKGLILNTFDDLEQEVIDAIKTKYPMVFTIGPLSKFEGQLLCDPNLDAINSNLWKEDMGCLEWLDKREPGSVVYVNFGSLIIMTRQQLSELARGLANSNQSFLWVIRTDLVDNGAEIVAEDYKEEIRDRGLILEWCPQERVLGHPSVGAFLTHCGWNSTLESISEGVAMMCWPFFADQQMNCLYAYAKWGVGVEIDSDVKREKVEKLLHEMMEGKRGKEVREKCVEWKRRADKATRPGGSSYVNFDRLVKHLMQETHPHVKVQNDK